MKQAIQAVLIITSLMLMAWGAPFCRTADAGTSHADALWINESTDDVAVWLMNGSTMLRAGLIGNTSSGSWAYPGSGDFDGDGKDDILWHDFGAGQVAVWLMNGLTLRTGALVGTVSTATTWEVVAIGDFNGDGRSDVLWYNWDTNQVAIWLMNGTQVLQAGVVGTASDSWHIRAVGDFDGDGKDDIVWRHWADGDIAFWFMNGLGIKFAGLLEKVVPVASAWYIQRAGDFNGDGNPDLLWRNTNTNEYAIWIMNGATIRRAAVVKAISTLWFLEGVRDFDGDGRDDILWYHATTHDIAIWFMRGTHIASAAVLTAAAPWSCLGSGDFNGH